MNQQVRTVGITVLFNLMIIFAVLAIHESGHYFVGMYVGCESGRAVLFDSGQAGPYTELSCSGVANQSLPYIGSLLFTLLFGSLFLFFKNSPERNLFFVVVGFSILTAGLDLVMLTDLGFLYYLSIGIGVLLIAVGEITFGFSLVEAQF
jgi:hypothetical protein